MLKWKKQNKEASQAPSSVEKMRRSIRWQAGLALATVALTLVLVFSMTAAWYTNVTQTSGLIIKTESWGFEGQIQVVNPPIEAAPGEEGVINIQVSNTNDSRSEVSVGVSKAKMEIPMQQRLYFYIDAPMARNGEIMDRVYLNSRESHSYTLFPGEKLELTAQRHTDALLKWQWVYDVLGYYVLGSWSADSGSFSAVDYLRPIEYDYDMATTTFTQDGLTMELETVDGVTPVEAFLVALSRTDGYPGQIDPAARLGAGYYPVAVDESGYGVYAYLCTYSQIQEATAYDTALAQTAKNAQENGTAGPAYEAVLQLYARKSEETVIGVSSLSAVEELLAVGSKAVVQLTGDITADHTLVLPQGSSLTLDLNGHSFVSTAQSKAVEVLPGGSLRLLGGKITGQTEYGIYSTGGSLLCRQVELEGFRYGVYVGDQNSQVDSVVRLVDCDLSATDYTVFVSGNGNGTAGKTQLVADNCRLTSGGMVICSNGSEGRWGTDIQILNSTLTSASGTVSTAVYHPQKNSTLTVYNSTLSGYTGMCIKGGSVSIQGSTVTGTGDRQAPSPSGSGFADTGDGIYIEANYGYDIELQINGAAVTQDGQTLWRQSVITATDGYSLQVYEPAAPNVTVQIQSGEFDEKQSEAYLAPGASQKEEDGKYLITAN